MTLNFFFAFNAWFSEPLTLFGFDLVYILTIVVLMLCNRLHLASSNDVVFIRIIKNYPFLTSKGEYLNPEGLTSLSIQWIFMKHLITNNKAIACEFRVEDILLPNTGKRLLKFIKENEDLVLFNSI